MATTQRSSGQNSSNENVKAGKQAPLDLSHHFSAMARRRTESSVTKFVGGLSTIKLNLGPGFPFSGNFPTDTLEGAIARPRQFPLYPIGGVSLPSTDTSRFTIPKVSMDAQASDPSSEIDLSTALQYQSSTGYPALAEFIQDWAINYQNQGKIPYKGPETLITGGAMDGLSKCLMNFADPGDSILTEEYVYFSARDQMHPFGVGVVPVRLDREGLSAESLEDILETWDEAKNGKRPHLLYTVTLGQNPTGTIQPLARKQKIYDICQKYDVLIFEDDPYWSLQYNIPDHDLGDATDHDDVHSFLASLRPSYLAIDTDGRVLSLQTFTKIFAPGCRVGWIVAQPTFIDKLVQTTDGTTSNPSGFAEAALAQVITREWGVTGFVRWIEGLRANYKSRRDVMCEALAEGRDIFVAASRSGGGDVSKELASDSRRGVKSSSNKRERADDDDGGESDGNPSVGTHAQRRKIRVYDFRVPDGGMYVWVDVNVSEHPLSRPATQGKPQLSPGDIILRLWNHLASPPYLLLTLPGVLFAATPAVKSASHHLRLTFAAAPATDCRRAGRVFAEGVKTFWEGAGWDVPSEVQSKRVAQAAEGAGARKGRGELRFREEDDLLARVVKHRFQTLAGFDLADVSGDVHDS